MIPQELVSAMRNTTAAIGFITVPHGTFMSDVKQPFFKVVGTAFIVRSGLVMTNRHVILELLDQQADLGFPDDQRILMFVLPTLPGKWQINIAVIQRMGHVTNREVDVGFVAFEPPDTPEFGGVLPLQPQPAMVYRASEDIAICGFPYGHAMLQKDKKVYRWGPIIQQGHISAISPYDSTNRPTELLLDVRVAPGMSGAAVLRISEGSLIGIAHSGWEATTALALPLDRSSLDAMLKQHDAQLGAA